MLNRKKSQKLKVRKGRKMKKKTIKKGMPGWVCDGVIQSWQLTDTQQVPAIEQSVITVVKYPVDYYQYFDYSPELMALRSKRIAELGWSSVSFDLPRPPCSVGEYSLFGDAIKKVASVLNNSHITAERCYPSTIIFQLNRHREDYCVLYFNSPAYKFYNLLFILGKESTCPFENVPKPKINTLNQLLRWAKSFEFKRRKMYKSHGFSWEPKQRIL